MLGHKGPSQIQTHILFREDSKVSCLRLHDTWERSMGTWGRMLSRWVHTGAGPKRGLPCQAMDRWAPKWIKRMTAEATPPSAMSSHPPHTHWNTITPWEVASISREHFSTLLVTLAIVGQGGEAPYEVAELLMPEDLEWSTRDWRTTLSLFLTPLPAPNLDLTHLH